MEIIRNCLHYSTTCVALELNDQAAPTSIVKASFDSEGAKSIAIERDGIIWYESQLKLDTSSIISFVNRGDLFARLELIYKDGICGDLGLTVEKNYVKILNALKYHIEIFEKRFAVFSHGDYSIENVIYDRDDVVWLVDWENFTKALPKGFDLIYCIMEACFFCLKKHGRLTRNDINAAMGLFRYVENNSEIGLPDLRSPASYIRKLFLDNKTAFGWQLKKYPFFNSCQEEVDLLDSYFKSRAYKI